MPIRTGEVTNAGDVKLKLSGERVETRASSIKMHSMETVCVFFEKCRSREGRFIVRIYGIRECLLLPSDKFDGIK